MTLLSARESFKSHVLSKLEYSKGFKVPLVNKTQEYNIADLTFYSHIEGNRGVNGFFESITGLKGAIRRLDCQIRQVIKGHES